MVRRLYFSALLALASCQEADPLSVIQGGIIGGTTDYGDPSVPGLWVSSSQGDGICTGSLISPRVILTAAHCIDPRPPLYTTGWQAYFGTDLNAASWGEFHDVVDHVYHPSFNVNNLYGGFDVGMLLLADRAPVAPIPINRSPLEGREGQTVRLVGFGATSGEEWGPGSGLKRETTTQLDAVTFNLIQFGDQYHNTCHGDSGGPNFMTINNKEVVVGITSFGDQYCEQMGASTRVDYYLDYIDEWVQSHDENVTCAADGACARGCAEPDPDCPCEPDGMCTAACSEPRDDPDCPPECGTDGVCYECPVPDPDCNPCNANGQCVTSGCLYRDPDCGPGGAGAACSVPEDCESGMCIPAFDEPTLSFCTQPCGECPGGMRCAETTEGALCVFDGPSPGAMGWACSDASNCASRLCLPYAGHNVCSAWCNPDDAASCAGGFDCVRTAGAESVCLPHGDDGGGDDGWCAIGAAGAGRTGRTPGSRAGGAALALLAAAGLLAARRRRRG